MQLQDISLAPQRGLASRWSRSSTWMGRARPLPALVAGATLAGLTMTPAPTAAQVSAQTPLATPAELVGTWVRTAWGVDSAANLRPNEMIYTLRADGTASLGFRDPSGESTDKWVIEWGIRGDTLLTLSKWTAASKAEAKANANWLVITPQGDSLRIQDHGRFARQGDQLLWGRIPDFTCADTLRRVQAAPMLPPLPTSPPGTVTVNRAALVGTWVGVSFGFPGDTVKRRDITTDTLTLQADSTSRLSYYSGSRFVINGRWQLYPGNLLAIGRDNTYVIRSVKDGVLTLTVSHSNPCRPEWVYQQVSP